MKIIAAAVFAVFAVLPLSANELTPLSTEEIREFSSDISLPEPQAVFAESSLTDNGRDAAEPLPAAKTMPLPAFVDSLEPRNGLDPVVITIPGLKFGEIGWGSLELRNILRLISFFTRNKEITEADIVNGVVAFSPRYFFADEDEDGAEFDAAAGAKLEDNYLEQKLKEIPGYSDHNVIVLPFAWSRDPGDTRQTLPQLQARITEVYDSFKGSGRPIYILAHSWGSVLAHTALHRVSRERPDVRIEKLITAGSPLVPANFVVKLFMKLEVKKEKLEKRVSKPAAVKTWRNFWALRDAYSNSIPAADTNFQADETVENVEPTLIQLILHSKPLKKEARKDLFKIRNIKAWHSAYFFDYQATLKSIQKEIFVPVFQPALAPQVVDCSKTPAAGMCHH